MSPFLGVVRFALACSKFSEITDSQCLEEESRGCVNFLDAVRHTN